MMKRGSMDGGHPLLRDMAPLPCRTNPRFVAATWRKLDAFKPLPLLQRWRCCCDKLCNREPAPTMSCFCSVGGASATATVLQLGGAASTGTAAPRRSIQHATGWRGTATTTVAYPSPQHPPCCNRQCRYKAGVTTATLCYFCCRNDIEVVLLQ